jgi:hypothetical protein
LIAKEAADLDAATNCHCAGLLLDNCQYFLAFFLNCTQTLFNRGSNPWRQLDSDRF